MKPASRPSDAPRERAPRRRRWVTVGLVVAFGAALAIGGAYHRAEAQLSEGLLDLGGRMMRYSDAETQSAPREVVLNGQVMHLSSGVAAGSVESLLDRFEARCDAADGELMEQLAQLQAEHPEADGVEGLRSPTLRRDDGERGYVACLDLGPESVTATELVERLHRYGDTGDVAEVGEARYVFAEESGGSTHFVALWTSGSFNLRAMFPQEGDVPGEDPDGIARPPSARRVLQGFERGQPHVMTVYETRSDEADLERFFHRALTAEGWSLSVDPTGLEASRPMGDAPTTFVAERGDRMAVVVLHTSLRTGHASAAVFETR